MKISHSWLQEYFSNPLPSAQALGELLTMHAFEVESIETAGSDSVLDVKVLPDRSHDCLSHRGIALEVGLSAKIPLDAKKVALTPAQFPESNSLKVEIADPELCRRFSAVVIEGVEVKESPLWLQERLRALGQRSINNIVDATNYVMFSLGQPLHAYDRDLLAEESGSWKLVTRKGRVGERLTVLDGTEHELSEEDLVIADGTSDTPLGFAGIKGGIQAEISEKTKNIVVEAANFHPILIRKNAKRLSLRTDASVRFENEITPELTLPALAHVVDLILEIAQGEGTRVEGMVDVYPRPGAPYKVGFSLSEIRDVLGIDLSREAVEEIFARRGFEWMYADPRDLIVKNMSALIGVPYKRGSSVVFDAPRSFDCSSLTAYLHAQAGVAIPRISVDQYVYGTPITLEDAQPGDLVFANSGEGTIYTESIEWMKGAKVPEGVDHVGIYRGEGLVIHASKSTGGVVEQVLAESPSFKNIMGFRRMFLDEHRFIVTIPPERLDLRIKEDLIEEIGRIYGYQSLPSIPFGESDLPVIGKVSHYEQLIRSFFVERGFSEVITYVFQPEGEIELQNPLAQDKKFLRSDLVSGLSRALRDNMKNKDLLGLDEVRIFEIGTIFEKSGETTSFGFAIPQSKVSEDDPLIRELTSELSALLGTPVSFQKTGEVFTADLSSLLPLLPDPQIPLSYTDSIQKTFKPFSPYPVVLRDIAVFVPEGDDQGEIIRLMEREATGLLVNYRLFDTFTKEFPEGKKTSYAYRLVFQSFEKTLTDEEILPIMEKVTNELNAKSGWQVR